MSDAAVASELSYLPLPRVDASDLSYERFLREFALPRQPFILTGVGEDWPARSLWRSLEYFLSHGEVDAEHEVTVGVGDGERDMSVGAALSKMSARQQQPADESSAPLYLSAWDYLRGGSGALQRDFSVPTFFERSPDWLASHVVLGNAKMDLRWLYIGEAGSSSPTHVAIARPKPTPQEQNTSFGPPR